MRTLRLVLIDGLLVVGGVLTGLLLLDVGLRFLLPHPQVIEVVAEGSQSAAPSSEGGPVTVELDGRIDEPQGIYVSTPTGRRLRPNAHAIIRNHHLCRCTTEIRTNSLGYRNPELGEKGRRRVLFLGDSITLADYVQEHESWVRLVQELSEADGRPLEAINSGVWAIGLANEVAILLETGLQTDPDAVVLAWYLNDAEPSPGIRMLRAPDFLEWSWLAQYVYQSFSVLRSKLVEQDYGQISSEMRERWRDETARRFPPGERPSIDTPAGFNRVIYDLYFDWGAAWSESAWERMRPYFVELKRQADIHGFELFIVAFPVENQVAAEFVYDHPQQKLREVADDLGVPLLDLLPLFRHAYREWVETGRDPARKLFYDWCHHTPRGNRLIAEWVHEFLQEHLAS